MSHVVARPTKDCEAITVKFAALIRVMGPESLPEAEITATLPPWRLINQGRNTLMLAGELAAKACSRPGPTNSVQWDRPHDEDWSHSDVHSDGPEPGGTIERALKLTCATDPVQAQVRAGGQTSPDLIIERNVT